MKWWLLSLACFVAAIALLVASVLTGEGSFALFLIFPVIMGWGPIAAAGAAMLLLAILFAFIAVWRAGEIAAGGQPETPIGSAAPASERRFGGVVMIGPIPIAFGSDKKTAKTMMFIGIALFIILVLAFLFLINVLA